MKVDVPAHQWAAVCGPVAEYLQAVLENGVTEYLPPAFHGKTIQILRRMRGGVGGRGRVGYMYLAGLEALPEECQRTAETVSQAFTDYETCLEDLRNGKTASVPREKIAAAQAFFERLQSAARKSRQSEFAHAESPLLREEGGDDE